MPAQSNASVLAAPAPATLPHVQNARPEQTPAPAAHFAEPLPDEPKQTPQAMRSISIEFAPDGAQDVRVRLAERGGDVHISLHSADSAFAGRLADGVHDLVGTLAGAGYEAEAWTSSQGRQHERNAEEESRRNPQSDNKEAAEDFGAMMQQPNQEIS